MLLHGGYLKRLLFISEYAYGWYSHIVLRKRLISVRLKLSSGRPIRLVFLYGLYSHTARILISVLLYWTLEEKYLREFLQLSEFLSLEYLDSKATSWLMENVVFHVAVVI